MKPALALALFFALQNLSAQTPDTARTLLPKSTSAAVATAVVATPVKVPKATDILFALDENVLSSAARPAQIVHMTIQMDIVINGKIVIASGQSAFAKVKTVRQKGSMGRAASITLEGFKVQAVDGQTVPLGGPVVVRTGRGNRGFAWGATIAVAAGVVVAAVTAGAGALLALPMAPAGLLMRGRETSFEKGEMLTFSTVKEVVVKP